MMALKGICWIDDSQVWKLTVVRGNVVPGGALRMVISEYEEVAQ